MFTVQTHITGIALVAQTASHTWIKKKKLLSLWVQIKSASQEIQRNNNNNYYKRNWMFHLDWKLTLVLLSVLLHVCLCDLISPKYVCSSIPKAWRVALRQCWFLQSVWYFCFCSFCFVCLLFYRAYVIPTVPTQSDDFLSFKKKKVLHFVKQCAALQWTLDTFSGKSDPLCRESDVC